MGLHRVHGRSWPHSSVSVPTHFAKPGSLTQQLGRLGSWGHLLILCVQQMLLKCEHLVGKNVICTDFNKNFPLTPDVPLPTSPDTNNTQKQKLPCWLRSELPKWWGMTHWWDKRYGLLNPHSHWVCSWTASPRGFRVSSHYTIILRVMTSTRLECSDAGTLLLISKSFPRTEPNLRSIWKAEGLLEEMSALHSLNLQQSYKKHQYFLAG